ncbi:MAG: ABC transporter permease [Terrisporobacter othiniensis]|uniref:FtsX-like permease family protein n=1 Tax=Terrisporobacter othiniensis TaxID=1577792 RepID=UPI00093BC9CC|nr:ABC transporter permease [Terrisporobacter othiniensis]MDY3374845.1 ABC transporter permease [Terrisporobacter othiniensis]
MNFFKLSFMNLRQNIKNYGMYIFSMIFSIVVFYNFVTLMFSEQFRQIQDLNVVSTLAMVCAIVLFLFFIFFISYSSSFFIEQRKKEFGIYTFMGVENNKIALLFAGEGLLIGIIALVGGIFGGVLTNKLFLMALAKISKVNTVMKFEISKESILITSLIFLGILICVFIKEYIALLRTDITKLINATNIYQSDNSKNKTLQGILGLIVIILAYVVILYYKKYNIPFPAAILATVVMVIIGTMLLFKGFFTFIVSKLINNKDFLYKGTNVLSYNNIIFRIRDNNKVLGQIAVLITCCLTSVIVSIATRTVFTEGKESEYPYSIMYEGNLDNKVVKDALNKSDEKVDYKLQAELMYIDITEAGKKESPLIVTGDVNFIRYSDIKKICEYRELDNENKFLNTQLKDNEAIFIIPKNLINAFDFKVDFNLGNRNIQIIDSYAMNLFGFFRGNLPTIVVNDNTFDSLKHDLNKNTENISCITLKNFDNSANIVKEIEKSSNIKTYSVDDFNEDSYNFINSIYFIGLFMALVFIVSVGSIMYFKCISDASKDKPRFDTLRKIGTSQEYINKSIYKQVGIFFLFPAIVAIIHSAVASYAVTSLFNQDGRLSTIATTIIFTIIYITYYLLTSKKYISLTK